MLRFVLQMVNGKKVCVDSILSFELISSTDAACDGLRLSFIHNCALDEIQKVYAYHSDQLVFNGYVDTQRMTTDDKGFICFIYARSSACLLIDNEAEPITYNCPSLNTLYYKNAYVFGFKSALPKLAIDDYYEIKKGTSCYGVINNFVRALTNKSIFVDSQNTIRLLESSSVFNVPMDKLVSEKITINRMNAISNIDYKLPGDDDYYRHLKSEFIENRGIRRNEKINIASLPNFQKKLIAKSKLKNSANNYYCCELLMSGFEAVNLGDKLILNSNRLGYFDNYYISKIVYTKSKDGLTTRVLANKNIDLGEINYVAK